MLDEGKTIGAVARDLDLIPSLLANWVRHAQADRTKGKTGLTTEERADSQEDGMVPVVLFVAFAVVAAPAFAQSAYVAGAVGVDVSRFDTVEAAGVPDVTAGGEAAALSLRLGTAIGQRWGVELAFTRP